MHFLFLYFSPSMLLYACMLLTFDIDDNKLIMFVLVALKFLVVCVPPNSGSVRARFFR